VFGNGRDQDLCRRQKKRPGGKGGIKAKGAAQSRKGKKLRQLLEIPKSIRKKGENKEGGIPVRDDGTGEENAVERRSHHKK